MSLIKSSEEYPIGLRRLRQDRHIRSMLQSVHVTPQQMVQPLFVVEGIKEKQEIPGITGTFRDTPATVLRQIESDLKAGISKFLLFGVPAEKQKPPYKGGFTATQVAAIKKEFGDDIWLSVDVCLCAHTEHGHCGVINDAGDHVLNDPSAKALAGLALSYAEAGADCVAPSDMMDGRIAAIRDALTAHDLTRVILMSYSAKFASAMYGPFRLACDSKPGSSVKLTDRKSYQLDFRRPDDAFACCQRDLEEGADILMVKPAAHYMDMIKTLTEAFAVPFAAYYVSGEHAMVETAHAQGLIDGPAAHKEIWHNLVRAGAQILITYAARYAQEWLAKE